MNKLKVLTEKQFLFLLIIIVISMIIGLFGVLKTISLMIGFVIGYVLVEVCEKIFVKEEDETEKCDD